MERHGDARPAQAAVGCAAKLGQVDVLRHRARVVEDDAAFGDARAGRQQAHDRGGDGRFARTAFTDKRDCLTGRNAEADIAQHRHLARTDTKGDRKAFDAQHVWCHELTQLIGLGAGIMRNRFLVTQRVELGAPNFIHGCPLTPILTAKDALHE